MVVANVNGLRIGLGIGTMDEVREELIEEAKRACA